MMRFAFSLLCLICAAGAAHAARPEVPLSDPALEARAQDLAREIRCVVCENEPVALSSADIAVDMRAAIRERVKAGDSDAQVRRFFADRYGEFVLLRPSFGLDTLALWLAPFVLLLGAGVALIWRARTSRAGDAPLGTSADDAAAREAIASLDRSNQQS
jgi:cytochrome c-type biogenesis protein CcmH